MDELTKSCKENDPQPSGLALLSRVRLMAVLVEWRAKRPVVQSFHISQPISMKPFPFESTISKLSCQAHFRLGYDEGFFFGQKRYSTWFGVRVIFARVCVWCVCLCLCAFVCIRFNKRWMVKAVVFFCDGYSYISLDVGQMSLDIIQCRRSWYFREIETHQ